VELAQGQPNTKPLELAQDEADAAQHDADHDLDDGALLHYDHPQPAAPCGRSQRQEAGPQWRPTPRATAVEESAAGGDAAAAQEPFVHAAYAHAYIERVLSPFLKNQPQVHPFPPCQPQNQPGSLPVCNTCRLNLS
jgi:hypothetical protein